jgi:hypothetical protein
MPNKAPPHQFAAFVADANGDLLAEISSAPGTGDLKRRWSVSAAKTGATAVLIEQLEAAVRVLKEYPEPQGNH